MAALSVTGAGYGARNPYPRWIMKSPRSSAITRTVGKEASVGGWNETGLRRESGANHRFGNGMYGTR
jgi:hypothetical protein